MKTDTVHAEGQPPSRRERLREGTREEIKALARRQMAESGGGALALNAIARAMGMVPSALYRYYPDRDALITALIVDGFNGLAEHLEASVADRPADAYGERLYRACLAYRGWAIAHPTDFQLIFGAPIPGYQAPQELTEPAGKRVFRIFLDTFDAAHRAGRLRPAPAYRPELLTACCPGGKFADIAAPAMHAGLACWGKMHGMVVLELVGHLHPSFVDTAAFYEGEIAAALGALGL